MLEHHKFFYVFSKRTAWTWCKSYVFVCFWNKCVKTKCFSRFFRATPGAAGVAPAPPVLYQIRQNPYSQRTVWGININTRYAYWTSVAVAIFLFAGACQLH